MREGEFHGGVTGLLENGLERERRGFLFCYDGELCYYIFEALRDVNGKRGRVLFSVSGTW